MCLWDAESMRELDLESSDLGAAVRGFVPKHSRYFYEMKIAYTQPMILDSGDGGAPDRWDDVAVAHEKLDDHPSAITVIEAKDRRWPGLYTTHANRGTFLARAGRLDEGIADLERALVIDPKAHFGREKVQVGLYRWLARVKADPTLVERETFLGHELGDLDATAWRFEEETALAILGMMVFGVGDRSPHLWLGLGVLLAQEKTGWKLAENAIRRAEALGHPAARAVGLRLTTSYEEDLEEMDEDFAAGQERVAKLAAEEDARIRDGERQALFGY